MTKPLKRWSVNAVAERHSPLVLYCNDRPLTHSVATTHEDLSPIQYLLISIASCFALSCRAEIRRRKLNALSFEVVVSGDKESGSADNLLGRISIVAVFGSGITPPLAREITARAQPMCTVTNTLLDSPTIRFNARALASRPARYREFPRQQSAH